MSADRLRAMSIYAVTCADPAHHPLCPTLHAQGYQLTVSKASGKASAWTFPAGVSVPGNGYLLILADGLDTGEGAKAGCGMRFSLLGEGFHAPANDTCLPLTHLALKHQR